VLVSHELDAGAPMNSAAPIVPEERGRTNLERMQQHTHLPRLRRSAAIPLTLLTQRTGAATAGPCSIHDAQTSIGFSTLLLDTKLLIGWTMKGAIWLDREIAA